MRAIKEACQRLANYIEQKSVNRSKKLRDRDSGYASQLISIMVFAEEAYQRCISGRYSVKPVCIQPSKAEINAHSGSI